MLNNRFIVITLTFDEQTVSHHENFHPNPFILLMFLLFHSL